MNIEINHKVSAH